MKINIYLSGIAPTGSPWTSASVAGSTHDQLSEAHVRGLSGGCRVFRATVELPDECLQPQIVIDIGNLPTEEVTPEPAP